MKSVLMCAVFLLTIPFRSAGPKDSKPIVGKSPLSAEQVAVYKAFFDCRMKEFQGSLNVANVTIPLDISDSEAKSGCLESVKLENLAELRRTVHSIDVETIKGRRITLVDPAQHIIINPGDLSRKGMSSEAALKKGVESGLLTISEVAFDTPHHHAAMKYSFVCGGLCGNGGTVVFEKNGDKWKIGPSCAIWVM